MANFIRENHPNSAGIVYTYSRKDADTVADQLVEEGIIAEAYHSEYVLLHVDIILIELHN
jgi:superfamily II DNA helicase RecQ